MAEFRWIKTSLFLILLLQFTAAATGPPLVSVTVRDGDEVTLPCNSGIDDYENCNSTRWLFFYSRSRPAVVLVINGKIEDDSKDKSDRLSVSENCSLVIKKVTDEDVGRYNCRQIRSGRLLGHESVVFLSVAFLTEHKDAEEVTVICFVETYLGCEHSVKWLLQGPDDRNIETSLARCSDTASFSTSVTMNYESLKCEVTDGHTGEVEVFPFSPPQSSDLRAGWSLLDYLMLVLRVAELLLVTVVVVLLIRAQGNRRPPDRNAVHGGGDGHEGRVNYENVGDPSVYVRLP